MAQTILITGASTGIGRVTADYFQAQGWNVIATMRSPEKAADLAAKENVLCCRLDVTDSKSITQAITAGIERFGKIDVVLNNAGYGAVGVFEASTPEEVDRQINVNITGVIDVTRAILPHLRANGGGTIMTVSSMGGRLTFPLYSVYHATKFAVEGLMESMQYELRPFNIKLRLIEPGAIQTDFYSRSMNVFEKDGLTAYDKYSKKLLARMNHAGNSGSKPEAVAKVIFKAATNGGWKLRFPAAGNARPLLWLRKTLPDAVFFWIVRFFLSR